MDGVAAMALREDIGIAAFASLEPVIARATIEEIAAGIAPDPVGTLLAIQRVAPATAVQPIATPAAGQRAAGVPDQQHVARPAVGQHLLGRCFAGVPDCVIADDGQQRQLVRLRDKMTRRRVVEHVGSIAGGYDYGFLRARKLDAQAAADVSSIGPMVTILIAGMSVALLLIALMTALAMVRETAAANDLNSR